uniref:non-specific serine/threonine protein kinase n=1 Tax=Oryza nivara TaxID=4536 RepID=A0A0E0J3C5_ORYNI
MSARRLAATFLLAAAAAAATLSLACVPEERDALLAFRDGVTGDPAGRLATWRRRGGGGDCCRWRGVRRGGAELDDRGYYAGGAALVGAISPALLSLRRLRHLDLSRNYLQGSPPGPPPAFLGGLASLRYLNLSGIYFSGEVPPHLGNLSSLRYLDLSTDFSPQLARSSELSWLARMPSLRHLSLSSVDLSSARDWPLAIAMLPSSMAARLTSIIHGGGGGRQPDERARGGAPPPQRRRRRRRRGGAELDDRGYYAGGAALVGAISPALLSLRRLRHLDLSRNYLQGSPPGPPPAFLGGLASLRYLNLSGIYFSGEVPPHLGNLSSLRYLDLSTDFSPQLARSSELSWLARMPSLRHLSLSSVDLSSARDWPLAIAMLPSLTALHLSSCSLPSSSTQQWRRLLPRNLTNLKLLDLSMNHLDHRAELAWIWNITSLTDLNLMGTHLHGQIPDELDAMASLQGHHAKKPERPLQSEGARSRFGPRRRRHRRADAEAAAAVFIIKHVAGIDLPNNGMTRTLPDYDKLMHLTGLRVLDLSYNNLTGPIPRSMGNLSGLDILDLSFNNLTGLIPAGEGCFAGLSTLVLSENFLTGQIPEEIGYLGSLTTLDLYGNHLSGHVPSEIGKLANLTYLDISRNDLDGVITEEHFARLARLTTIDLSLNPLKIEVGSEWKPPFSLEKANFSHCAMGPLFPAWLQWQVDFSCLDISSTGINDTLPDWLSIAFPKMAVLDISENSIYGGLPANLEAMSIQELYLSSNQLTGHIPKLPRNITILDISINSLSGPLPKIQSPKLLSLILFSNHITGTIPESICESQDLFILDLANNLLVGELPRCDSMGTMRYLLLSNNSLSGEFPQFVQSCTSLGFLDLGWNSFSGTLPMWIGDLVQLQFLRLSYNMFSGNNISGTIPRGLSNLTAMTQTKGIVHSFPYQGYASVVGEPGNSLSVVTKGQELNYGVGILDMEEYRQDRNLTPSMRSIHICTVAIAASAGRLFEKIVQQMMHQS